MRFASIVLQALIAVNANAQTATPLAAAPAAPSTPAKPAAPGPLKLGSVTVTGTLRSRAYAWDWFQPASGNNNYGYSGNFLRLNLSQNRHTWQWNTELAVPFL